MNYEEAKKLREDYIDLKHFGTKEYGGIGGYKIEHRIIAPSDRWNEVLNYMNDTIDNEKALNDLNLMGENLKVYIIAENKNGIIIGEDLYNYLLRTSQLR
jgi:hypothetical protein